MLATTLVQLLLIFLSFTNALPTTYGMAKRVLPPPPSEDPFYIPPAGFESAALGTILRSRPVPYPISAFNIIPIVLQSQTQLLYRSADSFGNPIATVTTVLVPVNANTSKLLSYQVAEDASFSTCAPSYALQLFSQTGGFIGTAVTQIEVLAIGSALKQGWVVALPDHLGPKSTFLANIQSGHMTLDGIRAVLSSTSLTGVSQNPTITMWGYSGGSLASGFAAELASSYAPELSIAGTALGGTVPDIAKSVQLINRSFAAGLLPGGILGLSHEYPDVASVIAAYLRPELAADFYKADQQCLGANVIDFLFEDVIEKYFVNDTFLSLPAVTSVLEDNRLGQVAPRSPIFLYKSINDEISALADTEAMYQTYCAGGASVRYQRDLASEHAVLLITGIPSAVIWLKDRMDGVSVSTGCSAANVVSSLLDPKATSILGNSIVSLLLELATRPATELIA